MTNEQIKTFIQGGKATFTLESLKTSKHYTFRAGKKIADSGNVMLFISLLVAPDHYEYLGTIFVNANTGELVYRETAKSPNNAKMHAVMKFFIGCLSRDIELEQRSLVFRHEGTCCVCSRPLTTPASIDAGIGPVCREKFT